MGEVHLSKTTLGIIDKDRNFGRFDRFPCVSLATYNSGIRDDP